MCSGTDLCLPPPAYQGFIWIPSLPTTWPTLSALAELLQQPRASSCTHQIRCCTDSTPTPLFVAFLCEYFPVQGAHVCVCGCVAVCAAVCACVAVSGPYARDEWANGPSGAGSVGSARSAEVPELKPQELPLRGAASHGARSVHPEPSQQQSHVMRVFVGHFVPRQPGARTGYVVPGVHFTDRLCWHHGTSAERREDVLWYC